MNTNNNTPTVTKTPKDILFDFADMLANATGTPENPNHEKALAVMMQLTALGNEKPVFVRKIFSEKVMNKIAEIVPKFQSGKVGMLDLVTIVPDLKKCFDDA